MDLVFAPKPHTLILKAPSSFHFLPTKFHSLRPLSASKQHVKIQCELEGKINGSLSADFDARFVDRVLSFLLFSFIRYSLFRLKFTSNGFAFLPFFCSK
jgi:hypothetical protein